MTSPLKVTWKPREKYTADAANAIAARVNEHHANIVALLELLGGPGAGSVTMDNVTDATTIGKAVVRAITQAAGRGALGAAADSAVVHLADTSAAGIAFVDNDPTLAANSAAKLATQQAVRQYVLAKFAALIGAAPAELDTWIELVAAIQDNEDALAGIIELLAAKLATADAPELIRDTIAAALIPGANITITPNDAANTITIAAPAGSGGGTAPLVYNSGWPPRPDVDYPVFWIGGDAPEDAPPALVANDVWIPATGDNIDLGTILEAFQLIAGTANTIPYLSALNTFGNLMLRTGMPAAPTDTDILTAVAAKAYVDKIPIARTIAASGDFAAADKFKYVECNATGPITLTLQSGTLAQDEWLAVRSINTGIVTVAGAGVVAPGGRLKLAGQWSSGMLVCRAPGGYVFDGDATT